MNVLKEINLSVNDIVRQWTKFCSCCIKEFNCSWTSVFEYLVLWSVVFLQPEDSWLEQNQRSNRKFDRLCVFMAIFAWIKISSSCTHFEKIWIFSHLIIKWLKIKIFSKCVQEEEHFSDEYKITEYKKIFHKKKFKAMKTTLLKLKIRRFI